MLRKLKEIEFDKYIDFAYSLALDQSKSSYPTYTDGIKTKEDFIQSAKDSFSREDEEILLFEEDGEVHGWIHYYVLKEDNYLQIQVFNVERGVECAIDEFVSYVTAKYAGCTMYFGLPKVNQEAVSHLQKRGFTKEEESIVGVMHFDTYQLKAEAAGIVPVTRENYAEFAGIHNQRDEGMYWNTERILENLDKWHCYLHYKNSALVGTIYYTCYDTMLEIFGVDYVEKNFDEETFRALLTKVLNDGKKMNSGHLTFFHEEEEHAVVDELGFEDIGTYVLYSRLLV